MFFLNFAGFCINLLVDKSDYLCEPVSNFDHFLLHFLLRLTPFLQHFLCLSYPKAHFRRILSDLFVRWGISWKFAI